ncbi:uncharacterized protein [Aegilops tauschii subsp. strangulata]|uniref:uncharacterized protein n=1 Tax=Aegilops tauschii subsp. strangulata TaxID=200361 RepID=UPI00098A993C|nr:protein ALP1-like [Aegilops tauschii subsp. strangulata]
MFLHVVGHNQRFRVIHNMFRRSMETISRYFKQVLFAVGELRGEMIRRPSGQTPPKIRGSLRWYPYFKDCIGAIDGTHVTARVPRSQSAAYKGRKHYTSQNVLAAVDFDLRFTYVLAGWEGSAPDANILTDSMSRPDGINIPDGKFYLRDAGYACRPGILPPFRKTRYHLNEFSGRNFPRTAQELFNLRHSSLRVTVERASGALKNSGALMNTCLRRKRSSLTMLLALAMVWRHLTVTLGRTKGWSGQRQCGLTEVSAGFEEGEEETAATEAQKKRKKKKQQQ